MTTQDPKYKHKPSEKHTLEEVLKSLQDLIRNDLLDQDRPAEAAEKSATAPEAVQEKPVPEPAPPVPEDFAPVNPAAGPVNFDAVMRSLKDLVRNELNVDDEPVPAEEPRVMETDAGKTLEELADELGPLDEELTFEESMDIVPPPPTEPPMPELPGEISAEMLAEPESPPPPSPTPASRERAAPGTQQELVFDVEPPTIETRISAREPTPGKKPDAPSPATEPGPPAQSLTQETPQEPELAADQIASQVTSETAEENHQALSGEALPTIEVEETFDDSAFFEAAEPAKQAPATDSTKSDELMIIEHAPDLGFSETSPDLSNEPLTMEDLTLAPEPEKPELKLEEPASENLRGMPSVDFDSIEFNPPGEAPAPSLNSETPKPVEESLSVTEKTASAQETKPEAVPATEPPATVETGTEATPAAGKNLNEKAVSPAAGDRHEPASTAESVAPKVPQRFSLDDIPVLNEVVAPPAGSTLSDKPLPAIEPPLPAPERARDIVVRAVAKLNVEMRKTGGAGLDTKTILRLQQLIRQELENDGGKS